MLNQALLAGLEVALLVSVDRAVGSAVVVYTGLWVALWLIYFLRAPNYYVGRVTEMLSCNKKFVL